jgi:hypothetical protein
MYERELPMRVTGASFGLLVAWVQQEGRTEVSFEGPETWSKEIRKRPGEGAKSITASYQLSRGDYDLRTDVRRSSGGLILHSFDLPLDMTLPFNATVLFERDVPLIQPR